MKRKSFLIALLMGFAVGVLGFSKVNAESNFVYYETIDGVETITVCDVNDSTKCITMMDRNLGATKSGTGCSATDTGACGNHFQRGNNYGFAHPGTNGSDAITTASTTTKAVWDDSYNNSGYYGTTFIKNTSSPYDYWSDNQVHNGLRGGAEDSTSNNRGYDVANNVVYNVTGRQGPCPNGYHVPSAGEWNTLLKYRAGNYTGAGNSLTLDTDEMSQLSFFSNTIARTQFQEDFKIPFAGYRYAYNAYIMGIGFNAYLQSSSPHVFNVIARNIKLDSSAVFVYGANYRANAKSVRCFKNFLLNFSSTMFKISFYDEDQTTQIWSGEVESGTILSNSGTVMDILADYTAIIKTGHTFSGRFISGTDTQYNLETAITENLDLVARWDVNKYTIIFDTDGGSAISPITAPYNAPVSAPANPTKAGAVFDSWSPAFPDTMPLGGATLKAIWRNALSGGCSAGGGGIKKEKDDCPNGDYSDSFYDGICGKKEISEGEQKISEDGEKDELQRAYERAYENGIITMDTIPKADLNGLIIRSHLAKMMSQFAINVMGKAPEIGKKGCDQFKDIENETEELKGYMKTVCELGLMGLHSDGETVKENFDPNDYVTRAEFGTVLSRFLYGDENNLKNNQELQKYEWYQKHLLALKRNGIMTMIDGEWVSFKELRGYVMVMLMRSAEK